jgi:uncharacterized membrane protein
MSFRRVLVICTVISLPLFAAADNVMLLGDTDAELQIQPALEAAGHVVTFAGTYYNWDGVTPNVADFDVVVLLDGYDYGYALQPAAATALQGFVASGCGLVTTEWMAYDVCQGYKGAIVGDLLPVTMPVCGDYGEVDTWTVIDPSHPLVAGLPASWSDDAGWSTVTAKSGAEVVVSGTAGNPMVVTSDAAGGTVVYLNQDMTYTTTTINANAVQLVVNATEYASCAEQVPDAIPVLSGWGIVLMSILVIMGAAWAFRRAG